MSYVRIVPRKNEEEGATSTMGTKVYVGEEEVHGIVGVTITGKVDDVWRATIEVIIQPEDLEGIHPDWVANLRLLGFWDKWKLCFGKPFAEFTNLSSTARTWFRGYR